LILIRETPYMEMPSNTPPAHAAKPFTRVVSSFLLHQGKFLILKRSMLVGSFQGYWSCISGYRENEEQPLETALREISEETQKTRSSLTLLKSAGPFYSEIPTVIFESHWFLFESEDKDICLDWEHDQINWIEPAEIKKFKTVPWLENMIKILT